MAKAPVPAYLKDAFKEYGKIVIKGNELLEQRQDLETISISPAIDLALNGGIREGSWLILSGAPKSGKDQPLDSIVYTPQGPKTMGSLKVGDEVSTPNGSSAKINGIYPQGVQPVYKITFNDNTSVRCGLNHLWKVCKNDHKRFNDWEVLSLKDILEDGITYSDRPKWKIPLTDLVHFEKKDVLIDPYILGCLIGDGGLTQGQPIITSKDPEIIEKFKTYAKENELYLNHKSNYDYGISDIHQGSNKLTNLLRELDLMGCSSHDKFIPTSYLYNNPYIKFELVKGLMDTDGYNNKKGGAEYTTVSKRLAYDMQNILQSLGFTAKIISRVTKLNDKEFPSFRIHISGSNINKLFSLPRKQTSSLRKKGELCRTIKRVEYDGKEETQCISIDGEDNLYLTDNYAVTHNTTTSMQLAKNFQDEGRPVIYLNTEGRLNQLNFQIEGLDPEKIQVITAEDKPIAAEDFLQILYEMLRLPENEGALCIIDSISSLAPKKDLEGQVDGMTRPGLPKILSDFVKKTGQIVPKTKTVMCLVTHLITNTSGFGKKMNADGGVKIQFQSDTRMEVKQVSDWKVGDEKIGQQVSWKIYYSGLGAKAFECDSWIRYGKGIDKIQEALIIGQELGMISKSAAWFTCDFILGDEKLTSKLFPDITKQDELLKACKFQGADKLRTFLAENPFLIDELMKQINEVVS